MKNVYLCGMPLCGKSFLGKMLSKKLKRKFIDLDKLIEKKEKKSIRLLVKEKGLSYFRKIEKRELKKTSELSDSVIALGGGITLAKNNGLYLTKKGFCIFLDASLKELKKRISLNDLKRPLLNSETESEITLKLNKLFKKRIKHYKNANLSIKTGGKPTSKLLKFLLKEIKKNEIHDKNG